MDNRDNSDMVARREEAMRMREERKNKKQQKKKNKGIKNLILIFAIIVAIYVLGACISLFRSNLTVADALNGSVQEEIRTYGYIYRTQDVIDAPWDGHFESLVSEGERVKAGQVIGYIYRNIPNSEIVDEIKKLHRLIRISGAFEESEYIAGGTGVTEKKLSEISRDLSDERQNYDLSIIEDKKDEINLLLERRNSQLAVDDSDDNSNVDGGDVETSEFDEMKTRLSELEKEAGESVKIVAEAGGVFSARIDGMEEMLAYENADSISPSKMKELDKLDTAVDSGIIAGQPLCKIVNNYTWKYAAMVSEKEAEDLEIGQSVQMRFYDLASGTIKGTISRISEVEGGKRTVVISANRYVDGIYATSRTSADIVTVDCSGIKLPSGSIRVKDGITGVYVIRLDKAHFVPVNIIYRNDEWAIVSAAEPELGGKRLQIYDEVIVECKNLEDGKIVR